MPHDAPHKILVCEDDDVMTDLLVSVLESEGYAVETAPNGHECLERFDAIMPDLLILDLEMPRKDGFEVLTSLHRHEKQHRCRVIVISANQAPRHLERARSLGAEAYLIKPFEYDDLAQKVRQVLKLGHG